MPQGKKLGTIQLFTEFYLTKKSIISIRSHLKVKNDISRPWKHCSPHMSSVSLEERHEYGKLSKLRGMRRGCMQRESEEERRLF
jgi:hypothetical protein